MQIHALILRIFCKEQRMDIVMKSKPPGIETKSSLRVTGWLRGEARGWKKAFRNDYDLYLLILPVIAYFVIFCYIPMYGIQIAFKNFNPGLGIEASPWVGLDHFYRFINGVWFGRVLQNTLTISIYSLLISIPAPIILALLFNEIKHKPLRVVTQAVSYAPNFISTVVMASMIIMFLTPGSGFLDAFLRMLGYSSEQSILNSPSAFSHIYVWSGIWQGVGWSSVIYTAAIEGVPAELYEAAKIEGASKLKQIWYITLPTISPTIIILAILAVGGVLNVGYEKAFLLQTTANVEASEVISTYVYKTGLVKAQYSFGAMVGLFNNVINFIILFAANALARRLGDTSLW